MKKFQDDLWPRQVAALVEVADHIGQNKPIALLVGQRGGKTILLRNLIDSLENATFDLVGATYDQIVHNLPVNNRDMHRVYYYGAKDYLARLKEGLQPSTVVIIEDSEWIIETTAIAERVNAKHKTVVMSSSRGNNATPEYLGETPVTIIKGATWDWNPNMTPKSMEEQFDRNFDAAARDFGLYDSKDPKIIDKFVKRYKKQLDSEFANQQDN